MISSTSPSAFSLQPWVSPKRDNQSKGQHVHHAHHRDLNPRIKNQSLSETSVIAPELQNVPQQTGTVQTNASNLRMYDLNESLSQSFAIEIKTKEGDVVSISYNGITSNHQNAFEYQDENSTIQGYQQETSSHSEFTISINGNINDDEQEALQDLMQQMQKVGHAFFKNDTQSAFQKAQKMGFDTEQIAGFSMSLNMEKSVQAVSAYQQVSERQPVDTNVLKQAGDFYNQAVQSLDGKVGAVQVFANPFQAFQDLAKGIVESLASQFPGPDQAQQVDTLKKLLGLASGATVDNSNSSDLNSEPLSIETPVAVEDKI